jgi:hypothetical protein
MNPFAVALASAETEARPARGRAVPVDPIAEPADRPVYPRYVTPFVAAVTDLPRIRPATPAELRAQAARYRARVARELYLAKLAARHESARIGGA